MSMQMSVCVSKPGNVMELDSSCSSYHDKICDSISCESSENFDSKSCEPHPNLDSNSCQTHQKLHSTSFEPHNNLDRKSCGPHENLDSKSYELLQNLDSKSCEFHQNLDSKSCELHQDLGSKSCEFHHNLDSKTNAHHHDLDSKPDKPHLNLDSKSCHEDLGNTVCEPHQNLDNTVCEPYQNLSNTVCQPHQNLGNTVCQPHQNLGNTVCQPHQNLSNTVCQPHQNLGNTVCQPHQNLGNTVCEPHQNLSNTVCQPHQNPGNNPHEHNHNPHYRNTCELNQNSESDPCGCSQNLGCSCKQGQCCHCAGGPMNAPHGHLWEDQVEKELIQRWEREQAEYREKLITEDMQAITSWLSKNPDNSENSENSETSDNSGSEDVKEFYIGGADISFIKGNNIDACSCLTVVRMSDLQVVYQRIETIQLTQPYVPGYLAFREVQPLVDLYNHLRVAAPQYLPDVIMVDGNGLLHPRGFGLACHLGVVLGVPTLGVAKTLITAQGIHDDQDHKLKKQTLKFAGDFFDLVSDSGQVLGRCVRTCDKAPNPVYISVGHQITLESAMQICLQCSKYRIPEPVRKADIDSREFLRQNKVEPYEFIQRMNEGEDKETE
ncbi:hypothetical protein BsWGS_17575 [Bradybaena similaris]